MAGTGKVEDFAKHRLAKLEEENAALRTYAAAMLARVRENEALYRKLYALEREVLMAGDPEDACFALLKGLRADFGLDFARIWLFRESLLSGRPMQALSERDLAWIEREEIQAMGLSEARPVRLMRLESPGDFPWASPEIARLGSLAAVLLGVPARPVGVLGLGALDSERFAPGLGTDFLAHLGETFGLVLEHAAARERIAELALCDPVSGMRSQRFLRARSHQPLAQWFGEEGPTSCLVLDIDDFHAHESMCGEAATELLEQVARALQHSMRRTDPVVRLEHDAFAAFLPGCPLARARTIAERARARCARLRCADAPVSVSIGVAEARDLRRVFVRDLVARAERAMFVAKALGGGRVEVSDDTA